MTAPELCCVPVPPPADVVRIADSLSAAEGATCAALRFPRRRSEWLAGRLAAKELVRSRHRLLGPGALRTIEIGNRAAEPERGRPFYRIDGRPGPFALSISHSGCLALAALARSAGDRIGVDVERVERREASFEALALAGSELCDLRGWCGLSRARAVTRIWALKEALLKALGLGLRVPLPWIRVRGDHAHTEGAWSFDVTPEARDLHPSLAVLERVPVVVAAFERGDHLGAWVVLPHEEDACNRP